MMLTEIQLDALTEVINIGVGRAANSLSQITRSPIELNVPRIHICGTPGFTEFAKTLDLKCATSIRQGFDGDLSGQAMLAFSSDNAFELARIVGGIQANQIEMDEEVTGVLEEIGNIVLNAVIGSIANILDCRMSYTMPELCTKNDFNAILLSSADDTQSSDSMALLADTAFTVASRNLSGSLLVLFETGDIKIMLSALTDRVTA